MIRTGTFTYPIVCLAFAIGCFIGGGSDAVEPKRIWVDANGRFSIEARLIEISEQEVVLLRNDGEQITIEVDDLSERDKEYLEEVQERAVRNDNPLRLTPPDPPQITPLPVLQLPPAGATASDGAVLRLIPARQPEPLSDPPAALVPDPSPWTHALAATRVLMQTLDINADWSRPIPVTTTDSASRDTSLAMSVSGRILIPGQKPDNRLLRFDVRDREVRTALRYPGTIRLVDHHPDSGRSLVHLGFNSSGKGGELAMATGWGTGRLRLSHRRKLSDQPRSGAAHLRWARWVDDEHIITVVDRTLGLWNIVSGEQLYRIDGIDHRAVPVISGGRRYVAVPEAGAVSLYATTTAQPLGRITVENQVPGLSFSPQGDTLAILTSRRLRIWDLPSATLSAEIACRRSLGKGQPIWIDRDLVLSSTGVLLSLFRGLPIWRYDITGTETVSIGNQVAMLRRHPIAELAIVSLPHEAAANAMRWMDSSPAKVDPDHWSILGQSSWSEAGWVDRDVQISALRGRLR